MIIITRKISRKNNAWEHMAIIDTGLFMSMSKIKITYNASS